MRIKCSGPRYFGECGDLANFIVLLAFKNQDTKYCKNRGIAAHA